MNERFIENVKVICRRNKLVYIISKILYSPIALAEYIRFKIELSSKIKIVKQQLRQLTPTANRVFYVGVPTHENLGDAAQMMCIRLFIKQHFKGWDLVELESWPTYDKNVRRLLEKVVQDNNVFITESGATFSDRHEDHGMHRYLLSTFKHNKILLMPETVDLPDEKQMRITADLFNGNHNAVFLARDPESYRMVENQFNKDRIFLNPDIVTTLIGNVNFEHERNGILVCKRIDGEKKYTDSHMSDLLKKLSFLDHTEVTDTNFDKSIEYTYAHLEEEIYKKLDMFSQYKVVLTDRYHGMIFALVSNTPVVVLPTTGHKVRIGAQWFKEDYPESIYFCETLEEAYSIIKTIIDKDIRVHNKSIYKERYFDELLKTVKFYV